MGPLLSLFFASLLGSPHCAAMCGGFVGLYSSSGRVSWIPHALYNFGRLVTYTLAGALAAILGERLDLVNPESGMPISVLIAGTLLIVFGSLHLFQFSVGSKLESKIGSALQIVSKPLVRGAMKLPKSLRAFTIGLASTLLPCGWLYAFVLLAATTQGPLEGATVMFVFWLGTLPVMLSLGVALQSSLRPLLARVPRLSAALVVLGGALSLWMHSKPISHEPAQFGDEKTMIAPLCYPTSKPEN